MKQICNILFFVLAGCLLTSCSEEIFGGDGASGKKVTLTLNYEQSLPKEVTVSRAAATSDENALHNLQIFIFDENKKLKGYKWISGTANLNQTGEKTSVTVKTTTGKSYIYAVANVPTSLYSIDEDVIPTSDPTASTNSDWKVAWNESNVQSGKSSSFTLAKLKAIAFNRKEKEFGITDGLFMMSGMANDGELCTINSDGSVSEGENLIKLRRIVSKIKFEVTEGTGVEFTPTSYEIRNIPREGQLIEDGKNINVTPENFETLTGIFSAQNTTSTTTDGDVAYTYMFDAVYLPENIQNQNIQHSDNITKWVDREKDNGDYLADKTFTNAPLEGTYLVLKGDYTGPLYDPSTLEETVENPTVKGNAIYFIHLGDFGTNLKDFNVDRNSYYKYKVTVKAMNSIWAEVDKTTDQTNGSAEGLVFNIVSGKVYDLDSHYEKLDMTFTLDDVIKDDNKGTSFIYFMGKD